jgi:uncharacterized protein YaaR (DUF327 family)
MSFLTTINGWLDGLSDQPAFSEKELNLMLQGINPATQPEELSQMQTYEQAKGLPPIQLEALERLSSQPEATFTLPSGEVRSIMPGQYVASAFGRESGRPMTFQVDGGEVTVPSAQAIQTMNLGEQAAARQAQQEFLASPAAREMSNRMLQSVMNDPYAQASAEREARMEADILNARGAYVRDPNTGKKVAAGSKDHAIIIEAERAAERAGMTGSSKKNAFMALYKEQRQEQEEFTKDLNDLKLQYETYRTQGKALDMEKTRAQIEKYQKSEAEKYAEVYSVAEKLVNDGLLDEEQAVFFIINKMGGDTDDIFGEKGDVSSFIEQAISNVGGKTSPVQEFFNVEEAEAANLPPGTKVIINGRTATVQ